MAPQFAFVLSFSVSLALVLALVVSWPRLIGWLGRSWWRPFCLALSLILPILLLLILSIAVGPIPPIFPYFFGFLAALGTSQLLLFSRRSQATIAASLPWLIIFLFSVIAGIYPDVSASLFSTLREARIEATGIHIILDEERSRDAKLPVFEFDARPLVTARDWPYKSGMQSLRNLTDDILVEIKRLNDYCKLPVFQQFCGDEFSGDMQPFLSATRAYFTAILPLVQCLDAYGHRFPNGVPIQDELSEIVMSFTRRDNANGVNASHLDNNLQELMSNIVAEVAATTSDSATPVFYGTCQTRLQSGLNEYYSDFAKMTDEWSWFDEWIPLEHEKKSSNYCENAFSTQDQKLGCRVWQLINIARDYWQKTWINEAKPPYRALFETYVITAAGYPQDAAYYIEREYEIYKKQGLRNYGRLANWLFSLRTLHARERMLEEAGDFIRQSEALTELSEVYDDFFSQLVGTDQIGGLLKECGARWENADLWKGISESGERADVRDFLSRTLFFHMKAEVRRWQTQNKKTVAPAELREIGDEFEAVFADREKVFEGCFRDWMSSVPDGDEIEKQIAEMHAEFGLTSGAIRLAELVNSIERNEEYSKLSGQERDTVLCKARDIFDDVRDELPGTVAQGSWQESVWERVGKLSEAIDAWRLQC